MTWGRPAARAAAAPYTAMVNSCEWTRSSRSCRIWVTRSRRQAQSSGRRRVNTLGAKPASRNLAPSQPAPLAGPIGTTWCPLRRSSSASRSTTSSAPPGPSDSNHRPIRSGSVLLPPSTKPRSLLRRAKARVVAPSETAPTRQASLVRSHAHPSDCCTRATPKGLCLDSAWRYKCPMGLPCPGSA